MKHRFEVSVYLTKSAIVVFLVFTMTACLRTGIGSNYSEGSSPTVLYVQTGKIIGDVYLATSSFDIGDKVNFKITVMDKEMDIRTLYLSRYQPKDAREPLARHKPIDLKPQKEVRDSFLLETPFEISGQPGEWRVELQIEDSTGRRSNVYKVFIIVH